MKSNTSFKGRDAVKAQRESGVKKIMATFTCEDDVILSGRETIYRNGERCGWLSSAGFGHTIGKSIGMGYVRSTEAIDKDHVMSGTYELEVANVRVQADVSLVPLLDPKMERVKA
jgi:4-methylaminobutanoate oxidase (formaldehyde-forming)